MIKSNILRIIKGRKENMEGYIIGIIAVCVVGSIVIMLDPNGDGGGISRNIRLVFALCVILVCIDPIKSGIEFIMELDTESMLPQGENELEKYEDIFNSSYSDAEIKNLKSGIKSMLSDRFSVDESDCEIGILISDLGGGKRTIERISVTLYGSAIWVDTTELEKYLCGIFGCEVISIIG